MNRIGVYRSRGGSARSRTRHDWAIHVVPNCANANREKAANVGSCLGTIAAYLAGSVPSAAQGQGQNELRKIPAQAARTHYFSDALGHGLQRDGIYWNG